MDLKNEIEAIISEVKKNTVFDAHLITKILIMKYSDKYLKNYTNGDTEQYHGLISQQIDFFIGTKLERMPFNSSSLNIHNEISSCACWKKL